MNKRYSTTPTASKLVLASTSVYRRSLLERFGVPFTIEGPHVEETPLPNEDPVALVHRLARLKAETIAARYPGGTVIGSDQIAVRGATVLGKPGSPQVCVEQLQAASGQRVQFHTGIHVIHADQNRHEAHVDTTTVSFRSLSDDEIRRYVDREKPLDCAGGFKAEGLGIALFERIDSQDPTALIGLPLIWLAGALRRAGFAVP